MPVDLPSPLLVGMVHLPALPGAPASRMTLEQIVEFALADARTLTQGGFSALMVENFGDAPFSAGSLEPLTVAAMGIVVREIVRASGVAVGVNCLRNDAASALGIAAAAGAALVRVNVHTGVAATDQGFIEGRAFETVRLRERLCPRVKIFADIHVKHASPISQPDIVLAAEETAYRGRADAVIISGSATGKPADLDQLGAVKAALPDKLVLVGSGADAESIQTILQRADGAIVGSCLKPGGRIDQPVDPGLVKQFMRAARGS
jgi:uncharacterized protein